MIYRISLVLRITMLWVMLLAYALLAAVNAERFSVTVSVVLIAVLTGMAYVVLWLTSRIRREFKRS